MDNKRSPLTDYGKELLKKSTQRIEDRKKFIGPPLPFELTLERISKKDRA